ncbi:MAG: hypothetical protein ABW007_16715 [Chitinophagaceae bacterium]
MDSCNMDEQEDDGIQEGLLELSLFLVDLFCENVSSFGFRVGDGQLLACGVTGTVCVGSVV